MRRRASPGRLISAAAMLALAACVIYPLLWMLVSSLKYEYDIFRFPPALFAPRYTLEHYVDVWRRLPLLRFFVNTIVFAGCVSLLSVFLDAMAGYAFARFRFRGRDTLFTLVLITMMVPFQVLMIPLFLEVYKLGLLNTYAGLVLPRATSAFGIYMMRSFFVTLPKELEEAARIDGLSEFGIFRKIMLPLCTPALLSLGIFHLVMNWNDLLYPLMLTSTAEMRTLPAGLATFVGQNVIEYGPTLAGTVLSVLPLVVAYAFAQRHFIRGIALSGIKG